MPRSAPLQVLLFRHAEDTDVLPFEEAIVRGLQGGKEPSGYLATGEDLGIQLQVFSTAAPVGATEALDAFCHTLVVILIDNALLSKGDDALWDWLAECWKAVDESDGRHAIIAVPMEERLGDRFLQRRTALATLQLRSVQDLGERTIRPTMLSLLVLHECRVIVRNGLPQPRERRRPGGFLRLFISHAKIDGYPLAQSLKHQIKCIPWLRAFYDVDDIPVGANWQRALERAVASSLIIILRTEVYDSRVWCQQEVLWADEYATPAVLVDARIGLNHPAAALPFDRVPSVRIPDGNLIRILFVALREGLRFLYFMRLVEEMKNVGELATSVDLRVFSFPPSMAALLRATRSFASTPGSPVNTRLILYPDPPLRVGAYEAAHALVATIGQDVRLATPNTLAAKSAAGL